MEIWSLWVYGSVNFMDRSLVVLSLVYYSVEIRFRGLSTLTTTARSMTKITTTATAMVMMKRFFKAIRVYGNSFYGARLGSSYAILWRFGFVV